MNKSTSLFHYVKQAVYAGVFVWFILLAMNCYANKSSIVWAVGASALASSAYIVFSKPDCKNSLSRHILGSYVIAIFVGVVCSHAIILTHAHTSCPLMRIIEIVTAIAVGISLFLQTILNFQHPPAAGLSLILTSEPWHYSTIIIILIAVIILAIIARLLRGHIQQLE